MSTPADIKLAQAAMLKAECPHIASVVSSITHLIKGITRTRTPHFCVLKARLGTRSTDETGKRRFTSGVDESMVAHLLCKLNSSSAWSNVTPWIQSVDRMYLMQSGLPVLTSCESTVMDDEPSYTVSHIMATDVSHVDLHWSNIDPAHMLCKFDGSVSDVRVSLSHEEPVYVEELQERVDDMSRVDIRQRKSFQYTPSGEDRAVWSIDISLVWRNVTYADALQKLQAGVAPLYTVELRCLQPLEYLRRLDMSYGRLALSFAMKIADLFESTSSTPLCRSAIRLCTERTLAKKDASTTDTAVAGSTVVK